MTFGIRIKGKGIVYWMKEYEILWRDCNHKLNLISIPSCAFGVTVEHLCAAVTGTGITGAVQLTVHEVCEDHDCDGIEGYERRRDESDPRRRR